MKKILFVCSGNTCRSPMAEGLFNHYAKKNRIDAISASAGIFAHGDKVSENSLAAMKALGIDISAHRPTQLTSSMINEADVVLTMTQSHKEYLLQSGAPCEKIFTLAEYVGKAGDISDPFGGGLSIYMDTAKELDDFILMLIKKAEYDEN